MQTPDNKRGNTKNNSAVNDNVIAKLAENLRCQYLNSMGIQTWFDPLLVAPSSSVLPVQEVTARQTESQHAVPGTTQVDEPVQIKPEKIISDSIAITPPGSTQINPIDNIAAISISIEKCELCELHTARQQAVTGEGNVDAELFIIIDAPVKEIKDENALLSVEDKQMLQAMLQAIGYSISSAYITSLVKCRPPEQRAPYTSEMICCDEHLSAQIKQVQPDVIMVLGEQASQQLLVSQKGLTDLRLRQYKHLGIPVYASYHPGDLFNSSETKRKVWADLLQINKQLI